MNELPRRKLCELVAAEGRSLWEDARRCQARLEEACPEQPEEVAALVRAQEEQVPAKLVVLADGLPWTSVGSTLTRRLTEECGLSPEAARWAVESWALALGKGTAGQPAVAAWSQPAILRPEHLAGRTGKKRGLRLLFLFLGIIGLAGAFWWWMRQSPEVRRFEGHSDTVSAVTFTPDGRRLVSASFDKTVRVWDVDTGQPLVRIEHGPAQVRSLAVSPDGERVVSAGGLYETREAQPVPLDCDVHVSDLDDGLELRRLGGHTRIVWAVAYAPNGRFVLSAGGGYEVRPSGEVVMKDGKPAPQDCAIRMWDMASFKEVRRFEGHTALVWCLAISSDSRRLVSGSADGTVRLWDVATGQEVRRYESQKGGILSVALSLDGKTLLSSWEPGNALEASTVRLLDVASGEELRRLVGHAGPVRSVKFSPDGRRALTGSDDFSVRLWNVETGEELRRFAGHSAWVTSVAFSPDGRYAASGGGDSTVRLWKLPE